MSIELTDMKTSPGMSQEDWKAFEELNPDMANNFKTFFGDLEDEYGLTEAQYDLFEPEALDSFRTFSTQAKELEKLLDEQATRDVFDIDTLEEELGRGLRDDELAYIKETSSLDPEAAGDKARFDQADKDMFKNWADNYKEHFVKDNQTRGRSIEQPAEVDVNNGTWEDIPLDERTALDSEFTNAFDGLKIDGEGGVNFSDAIGFGALDSVEVSMDGATAVVNGVSIDTTTEAGIIAMEGIEGVAEAAALTAGRYAMLAAGMNVLAVVGVGFMVYDIVTHIMEDQRLNTLYTNEGDKYVDTFLKMGKTNTDLATTLNKTTQVNNNYTKMYYKYILSSSNPDKMVLGNGRQLPEFKYESDYLAQDSGGHTQNKYTYTEVNNKIENAMMSQIYEHQNKQIHNAKGIQKSVLLAQFNESNVRMKTRIYEGLERVRNGTSGVKNGFHPADNMKAMYDAVMENKQRQDFILKQYSGFYGEQSQDKKVAAILGTPDNRLKQHFMDQAKLVPGYKQKLQQATNDLNRKRNYFINQEFTKGKQAINKKYMKMEKILKTLPLGAGLGGVKQLEQQRTTEWRSLDTRQRNSQKVYTTQDVEMGYNPKGLHKEVGTELKLPFWVGQYIQHRKSLMESDITEARANQQKWEVNKRRTTHVVDETTSTPPQYHGGDDGDYNKFIDPSSDIKRTPRYPPKPPFRPPKVDPNKPPQPPKPLPPEKPKRRVPNRRLLGSTEEMFDMELKKDNEFDSNIAFDVKIAKSLLHICVHSYVPLEENSYFPSSDVLEYDIAVTMGNENFGATAQGRMYYSSTDNVISIVYRGTDFGRVASRPDLFMADLVNDINIQQTEFDSLLVHSGFLNFYQKTKAEVWNFIEAHLNEDTLIYSTGHSYGAVPSVLLGYEINSQYGERRCVNYNFGSPRGFDKKSAEIVASQLTSFRVADINDPVSLLPPTAVGYFHVGRAIVINGDSMSEMDDMVQADSIFNFSGLGLATFGMNAVITASALAYLAESVDWQTLTSAALGAMKTMGFIHLNKHSLANYDEMLTIETYNQALTGSTVKTTSQMTQGMDAIKDAEGIYYSATPSQFLDTTIYTQTDNPHLKFIPHYHRETGLAMMAIPHDLREAVIGFIELTDTQHKSQNVLKGIIAY